MNETLIPLKGFTLPMDFPWRVRFIAAVDEHLHRLRSTGHFIPPRFFGYYFKGSMPIGVAGFWTVTLERMPPMSQIPDVVDYVTQGRYSIASPSSGYPPDYMLIHDRRDGSCFLWAHEEGLRFVESVDPVFGSEGQIRSSEDGSSSGDTKIGSI